MPAAKRRPTTSRDARGRKGLEVTLSPGARVMLDAMAAEDETTKSAIVDRLIREEFKARGRR